MFLICMNLEDCDGGEGEKCSKSSQKIYEWIGIPWSMQMPLIRLDRFEGPQFASMASR